MKAFNESANAWKYAFPAVPVIAALPADLRGKILIFAVDIDFQPQTRFWDIEIKGLQKAGIKETYPRKGTETLSSG